MNTTSLAAATPIFQIPRKLAPVPAQEDQFAGASLHGLVSGLLKSFLPLTTLRHTIVLNEIPRDLHLVVDENMLAFVLGKLLGGAIQSTHDECIHIEALTVGDRLTVRIGKVGAWSYHVISTALPPPVSHHYRP